MASSFTATDQTRSPALDDAINKINGAFASIQSRSASLSPTSTEWVKDVVDRLQILSTAFKATTQTIEDFISSPSFTSSDSAHVDLDAICAHICHPDIVSMSYRWINDLHNAITCETALFKERWDRATADEVSEMIHKRDAVEKNLWEMVLSIASVECGQRSTDEAEYAQLKAKARAREAREEYSGQTSSVMHELVRVLDGRGLEVHSKKAGKTMEAIERYTAYRKEWASRISWKWPRSRKHDWA